MRHFQIITYGLLLTGLFFTCCPSGLADTIHDDQFHQAGIFAKLNAGYYDKVTTVEAMNAAGDMGAGGFERMDGELIQMNGTVYQVTLDGVVHTPPGDTGITFMNTVWFNPKLNVTINKQEDLTTLEETLNQSFPSKDLIYAIRLDGTFPEMKVRSLPVQEKPYPLFSAVVANESEFNLTNTTGAIIGFWFPAWMQGTNYAGFHLHYLTSDHTAGGHVLGCTLENGTALIDPIDSFQVDIDNKNKEENE